ncbi:hypothetical protein [Streptomyces sp. NPDC086519]|uniref:hypothetical protein n=1 Tax=Streptomyces sp. NPDC086519 TaxID=3154863 RepID=UPI003446DBF6
MRAAEAKAHQVVRTVADFDGGTGPYLMVAVIDPETHIRLATGFVAVDSTAGPVRHLRSVS